MIIDISFTIFAVVTYIFIFWRKLKEDYQEDIIFNTSFYVLIGLSLSYVLNKYLLPRPRFWLLFLGSIVGLFLAILKYKLRVFETLEVWVVSSLSLLGIFFLYDWLQKQQYYSILGMIVITLLYVLYALLDKQYKGFAWYKSGRVGFSGLAVLGVLFLIYSAVAVTLADVIPFVSKSDATISALLAFMCFLAIFNLARKTV